MAITEKLKTTPPPLICLAALLISVALIVLAPLLTSIYVRWANRHYDPAISDLRARREDAP